MNSNQNNRHRLKQCRIKKNALAISVTLAILGATTNGQSALPPNTTLDFDDGQIVCTVGGVPPDNCDFGLTDVSGTYFAMDTTGDGNFGPSEKTAMRK